MSLLNREQLQAPISDENPCGISKESPEGTELASVFSNVQLLWDTSRKIERIRLELALLPSGEHRQSIMDDNQDRPYDPRNEPSWSSIATTCCEIIESKSKDMRVVSWLFEPMVRLHGFAGLSEITDVTADLIEAFSEQLYPVDESNHLYAVSLIDRLNQSTSLIEALASVQVSSDVPISYQSRTYSGYLSKLSFDEQAELKANGLMTYDELEKVVAGAESSELQSFMGDLERAIASSTRLDSVLTTISGKEAYGFNRIRRELETIRGWYAELLRSGMKKDSGESTELPDGDSSNDDIDDSEDQPILADKPSDSTVARTKGSPEQVAVTIRNRQEALNSLLKVASFFRRTEPHSPISYALEQAVRWGKMPLPDLLRDLVASDEVLEEVYRRMGIQIKVITQDNEE